MYSHIKVREKSDKLFVEKLLPVMSICRLSSDNREISSIGIMKAVTIRKAVEVFRSISFSDSA